MRGRVISTGRARRKPSAHLLTVIACAAAAIACMAPAASAQEATNTPAATQPAVGALYLRQKFRLYQFGDDPEVGRTGAEKFTSTTSLTWGLRRDLSLTLDLPVEYTQDERATDRIHGTDFGDVGLSFKWRPVQHDLGPIDSVRLAFFGGTTAPTGGSWTSESWDPFIGTVFTAILGRHGINQSFSWTFNTGDRTTGILPGDGPEDALRFDTAYLYRIDPVAYAADTTSATYVTVEANGIWERNGDVEVLLSAGLLYEARSYALELSVGVPVISDVDHRPEVDLRITAGFRILF
ncbi:MAG: hypothetical protein AB8G96_03640 [Phycisphaerales bacterium]